MSVERFIEGLEERGLLSERALVKLRAQASERSMSARSLAKFLVEKKHITQPQATDLLGTILRSGADIDAKSKQGEEEGVTQFHPVSEEPESEEGPNDGDSSIFEAFLTPTAEPEEADDDELGLAPGSDDAPVELQALEKPQPSSRREPELAPTKDRVRNVDLSAAAPNIEALPDPVPNGDFGERETPAKKSSRKSWRSSNSSTKKKKKPAKRGYQWDSPLILLGGGALFLLVIGGVALAWLMTTESGDDKLKQAQEAVDSGSYTQAITLYQEFLENFPRHRDFGTTRVKLAVVKLRKATESSNFEAALNVAKSDIKDVEGEEKFGETAHAELAALLPRIAQGLAKEASDVGPAEEGTKKAALAMEALALAANSKYIPNTLRDEGELEQVRILLANIERRQQSQKDLQQTLAAMEQAVAAGDAGASYAKNLELVKVHPDLAADAALQAMIQKTAAAEQAAIKFVKEEQAAETTERPTPWLASLAIVNRRVKPTAAAAPEGTIACVRVSGAVYGIDVASGRVLWRRYVGHASAAWPLMVDRDVVVSDAKSQELIRLEAATGKLQWRQTIGEPFTPPLVVGDRGFVAGESGRLYVLDWTSGIRIGYLQFAQPLRVTPSVDRAKQRLYLPGDHSSLYTISLADFSCLGVSYLGHAEDSVTTPLVSILDKVVVLENDGVETSRLRLMSLGERGEIGKQVLERRLSGLANSPFVAGRRLIVITDRGQIEVFDVATGNDDKALTLVATRPATDKQPTQHYAVIAGQSIWTGDSQLTKFSILPTGNRLPVESIEKDYAGAAFDHPLMLFGETLVHVHRPKGRAGAVIAAINTAAGATLWETDLAVSPAGAPVVDGATKSLAAANAAGYLFRFDEAAIRARVQDEPLPANSPPGSAQGESTQAALTASADLGQGRAVFSTPGSNRVLLYNPALGPSAANWLQLDSPLACAVTPLGDAFIAPTQVGQVFLLNAVDGAQAAVPFQPVLAPGSKWNYQPAAVVDESTARFVITDGKDKIYLVGLAQQPQPHLEKLAEAAVAQPIDRPLVAHGESVLAAGSAHLARFQLPKLELAGESNMPAPVVWGPYRAGEAVLLATADGQLAAISATGDVLWKVPITENGDLAGDPLVLADSVVLAYRKGIVERRALADGKPLGAKDVENPLAAGPAQFLQRLVLTAADGTLLVVDQP